jgi:hypothetical protein
MKIACTETAEALACLYAQEFGGKDSGRYRISAKLVSRLMGRRRLYEDDVRALARAMAELGFVLVDMESFYVVLSANTFVNYRRANAECLNEKPQA